MKAFITSAEVNLNWNFKWKKIIICFIFSWVSFWSANNNRVFAFSAVIRLLNGSNEFHLIGENSPKFVWIQSEWCLYYARFWLLVHSPLFSIRLLLSTADAEDRLHVLENVMSCDYNLLLFSSTQRWSSVSNASAQITLALLVKYHIEWPGHLQTGSNSGRAFMNTEHNIIHLTAQSDEN